MTGVCDLPGATVGYVAEGRKTESLEGYYRPFTSAQGSLRLLEPGARKDSHLFFCGNLDLYPAGS